MARNRDPRDVVASIRRSIEVSPRRARRVRSHRLRDLFGFHAWSDQRRELVTLLFQEHGIAVEPPIQVAAPNDWVLLTLPELPPMSEAHADPRPSEAWFDHLQSVRMDSEREVEMHFASPLLRALGYAEENEAVGFRFDTWEGVSHRVAEADLLYFADDNHSLAEGEPLVLVECKSSDRAPDAGTGQAKSYAYWIKPAYYVTTNGNVVVVYNYQGGAVPDAKVLEMDRSDLSKRFDELYGVLSHDMALETRRAKVARLMGSPDAGGPRTG